MHSQSFIYWRWEKTRTLMNTHNFIVTRIQNEKELFISHFDSVKNRFRRRWLFYLNWWMATRLFFYIFEQGHSPFVWARVATITIPINNTWTRMRLKWTVFSLDRAKVKTSPHKIKVQRIRILPIPFGFLWSNTTQYLFMSGILE